MPPPGSTCAGAAHGRSPRPDLGRRLRADRRLASAFAADRLNRPAIPHHPPLSVAGVRGAGVAAAGARDMALIRDFAFQGAQMLLVLLLSPLLTGFVRKVKARLLRRQGPPLLQPYRDLDPADAQGSGARGKRVMAVPRHSLHRFRRHLGRGIAGADLPQRPVVFLVGRPHRASSRCSAAHVFSSRSPASTSAPASAALVRAAR